MQRLKNAIKKIATIGVGAAMLGATITSAVALDLAEYPAPFIVNGEYDNSNAIVVGAAAASSDTLGAVDIAARMQFDAKKAVSAPGTTMGVEGGAYADVPIDRGIANSTSYALDYEIDDNEVSSFQDTTINFNGADYNVRDLVMFEKWRSSGSASPSIETSLTSNEDDYEANVFVEAESGSIRYYYLFDESIVPNNATTEDPLDIKFLGKTLKITKVDSAGDKITAYVGNEYFMKVGDTVTVDGKKVTLTNVGMDASVLMDVDGTVTTVTSEAAKLINGIEIVNDVTFYEDTKSERCANLIIGADAQGTYKDGEAYIGEPDVDYDWEWIIKGMFVNSAESTTIIQNTTGIVDDPNKGTVGPVLGIKNYFSKNDAEDNPAGVGECYDLPNNYASICLDSLTIPDTDYITVTIEYKTGQSLDKSKNPLASDSASTVKISSSKEETLTIPTGACDNWNVTDKNYDTDTVWLEINSLALSANPNGGLLFLYYKDPDSGATVLAGNITLNGAISAVSAPFLQVNYKDTKESNIDFRWSNQSSLKHNLVLDIAGSSASEMTAAVDDIWINFTGTTTAFTSLGDTVNTEEAQELTWGLAAKQLGTKDEDHRTIYGIIIKDPKSNGASDKVVLEIPADQVQANVVVKGQATTVTGGAMSYISAKIDVNTMLDTDVASPTAHNLVLVGGPCVNTLTASLSGETCDGWTLGAGEALVKLVTNGEKIAMIVAGTTATDTLMACKVLGNYEDYTLVGEEQIVTGSISAPTIKTA